MHVVSITNILQTWTQTSQAMAIFVVRATGVTMSNTFSTILSMQYEIIKMNFIYLIQMIKNDWTNPDSPCLYNLTVMFVIQCTKILGLLRTSQYNIFLCSKHQHMEKGTLCFHKRTIPKILVHVQENCLQSSQKALRTYPKFA